MPLAPKCQIMIIKAIIIFLYSVFNAFGIKVHILINLHLLAE
jgi:hypothetical protein